MICTSSHKGYNSILIKTVAISGNRGKDEQYVGDCYMDLAPKKEFWRKWHDNLGKIDEIDNNKYYIEEYYKQVLSKLDPKKVYNDLDNSVLLCYESNYDFCHRHIVAAWLELTLGVDVPEIIANGPKIDIVLRPAYIKEYLNEIMSKDKSKVKEKIIKR